MSARPAELIGALAGHGTLVDQAVLQVLAAQHGHRALAVVVGLEQVVDDVGELRAFGGDGGVVPILAP